MAEYKEFQQTADYWHDNIPFIMEGQVIDTDDPNQMGRVRAWIPAVDGETFDIDTIPWAEYAAPFGGFTVGYPAGENTIQNNSHAAYGFWAIPKIGSTVAIFCMNGNPSSRFYFAATLRLHRNRSLPAGRNVDFNGKAGPWGDAGDGKGNLNPIQPAYNNLRTQFQNKISQSEAQTRGAYERSVAQGNNVRDGSEGYSANAADPSYLDSQTYCIVTPGRHAIIMQDDPNFSRLRFKTAEGHQIIFDDANERIYISTSKGNTWFEMDQDGHINVFGAQAVSMRSGGDINMFSDGSINMEAAKGVNIKADSGNVMVSSSGDFQVAAVGNIVQTACGIFDATAEQDMHLTATKDIDVRSNQAVNVTGDSGIEVKSGAGMKLSASSSASIGASEIVICGNSSLGLRGTTTIVQGTASLGFNSGNITLSSDASVGGVPGVSRATDATTADKGTCADQATGPSVIPGFEPWTRPASTTPRGPYWKK